MGKKVIVIGGGIVGLSTAMHLTQRHPDLSVTVLEKGVALAQHQTAHNSGVIHAGVYYAPGSLKAKLCREGSEATVAFCREHSIPFDRCGKLIVATDDVGLERLAALRDRCLMNELSPEWLDAAALKRREPRIAGVGAIFVALSGITDYAAIARTMARLVTQRGGEVRTGTAVTAIREEPGGVTIETTQGTLHGNWAVACGGLHADRLAAMCGVAPDFRIIPFRGEYYRLRETKNDVVQHLIYPVPDPALPFLGVHLTRMIGGYVTVGPNAVLAMAREGYDWSRISIADMAGCLRFPGFWQVLKKHGRSGLIELRNSLSKAGYLAECRKYCPELTLDDLQPHPAGVRAQAVLRDGTLVHDFLIRHTKRTLHVCNAPSPAATSAIPIGRHLAELFAQAFDVAAPPVPTHSSFSA